MRVSSNHYRSQAIGNISTQQAQLARLQEQASTGRKVNRASDDPLAAAEAERLRSQVARSDIEQRMMSYAKGIMAQTHDIMGSSIDALQEARDAMISTGNGILNEEDRKTLATKLEMTRRELYQLANLKDMDGNHVFGGPGTEVEPMGSEADPVYQGAAGTRATGMQVQYGLNVNGQDIFSARHGDAMKTVFQQLDDTIGALREGSAEVAGEKVREGIQAVDTTLNNLISARTVLGENQRIMEKRHDTLEAGEEHVMRRRSELVDADLAEVLSGIQSRDTALRAAMQTYSQISRLSMFDYL